MKQHLLILLNSFRSSPQKTQFSSVHSNIIMLGNNTRHINTKLKHFCWQKIMSIQAENKSEHPNIQIASILYRIDFGITLRSLSHHDDCNGIDLILTATWISLITLNKIHLKIYSVLCFFHNVILVLFEIQKLTRNKTYS